VLKFTMRIGLFVGLLAMVMSPALAGTAFYSGSDRFDLETSAGLQFFGTFEGNVEGTCGASMFVHTGWLTGLGGSFDIECRITFHGDAASGGNVVTLPKKSATVPIASGEDFLNTFATETPFFDEGDFSGSVQPGSCGSLTIEVWLTGDVFIVPDPAYEASAEEIMLFVDDPANGLSGNGDGYMDTAEILEIVAVWLNEGSINGRVIDTDLTLTAVAVWLEGIPIEDTNPGVNLDAAAASLQEWYQIPQQYANDFEQTFCF